MSTARPEIPRIDDTVTAANLHERCELIAVPTYDWISMPVIAIVDGLIHIDPDGAQPPARERTAAERLAASRRRPEYRREAQHGAASPMNADPQH